MGWHVATTCHLRRLFVFLCISGGTYIYVPIYVHTIKIHDILNKVISLIVSKVSLAQFYFLFDGPGMSFVEGIVCPQASQTCCDTPPSFGKDIPRLNFLFCLRGGDGGGEGLRGRKSILLGSSLEWNVLSSVVVGVVSQLLNVLTFMGGVEMGDGSDGSGDWGLYPSLLSPSVWSTTVMVARILNGLGGRFKSFKLGGTIGSCRPKP